MILENNLPEKFSVFKGVRQFNSLSTVLFDITLDHTIKKVTASGTMASKMTQSLPTQTMW
jgi:hypothetical protein